MGHENKGNDHRLDVYQNSLKLNHNKCMEKSEENIYVDIEA